MKCAFFLLFVAQLVAVPIVNRGTKNPITSLPLTVQLVTEHGYYLDSLYLHQPHLNEIHLHDMDMLLPNRKRSLETTPTPPQTRRDYVRDLQAMTVAIYPRNNLFYDEDDADVRAAKMGYLDTVLRFFNNSLFTFEDNFLGDYADGDKKKQVGLHTLVYKNPLINDTILVFQGSSADADFNQIVVWFGQAILYDLPDQGVKRWEKAGNSKSDLDRRDGFDALGWRFLFDLVFPSIKSGHTSKLEKTGISGTDAKQGYFFLAKQVVEDVIAKHGAEGLKLTGHSLGGVLATLISMYMEDTKGQIVDTVVFSTPGARCLASDEGWFESKFRPQITNYASLYDVVPVAGYQAGYECLYTPLEDAKAYCKHVFGFGIELYVDAEKNKQYIECNRRAHDFFRLYEDISLDDDKVLPDGNTNFGCSQPEFTKCPKYKQADVSYVFFIIFWCVLVIILLTLIVFGCFACVRAIHLKRTGSDAKIFPCFKCCNGGKCCGEDDDYAFELK